MMVSINFALTDHDGTKHFFKHFLLKNVRSDNLASSKFKTTDVK